MRLSEKIRRGQFTDIGDIVSSGIGDVVSSGAMQVIADEVEQLEEAREKQLEDEIVMLREHIDVLTELLEAAADGPGAVVVPPKPPQAGGV